MFAAVLDTCVLWPSMQRDFLLSLSIEGLYRPLWSEVILAELEYHEELKLRRHLPAGEARSRATTLARTMQAAFEDALVTGWEGLDGTYGLPDRDDEHVVAAAVVGGAGAIITENRKDFPAALIPAGIDVLSARTFLRNTVALGPAAAFRAVQQIAERSGARGPTLTTAQVLETLQSRYELHEAVAPLWRFTAPEAGL